MSINLVKAVHFNAIGFVMAYYKLLSELRAPSNFPQGCLLPSLLLNSHCLTSRVDLLPKDSLGDLEYASDIVLFGEDTDKIQSSDHLK